MTSEEMRRMIREVGEGAARTFDRKFVDACTYAVDPGGPELTATAIRAQMESAQWGLGEVEQVVHRAKRFRVYAPA